MSDDTGLCTCGHCHATTRGPCDSFHVCGCRTFRPELDTPQAIAARRRILLDATETRNRANPRRFTRKDTAAVPMGATRDGRAGAA